jgi:sucrose phosphorylase
LRNGVQLIAYADRFGDGGLSGLREILAGPLAGAFSGVHILPFYDPYDGADAGFDPIDHTEVDPRLGSWEDVAELAHDLDVTADLIVNHVSDRSAEFVDFLQNGDGSRFAGMFLSRDSVFPTGATEEDLERIYRPRPGLPFTLVNFTDGRQRLMWTTFGSDQVDIDVGDPAGRDYLERVLDRLALAGVAQVRLDAVGYAVKTPGTSCFMTADTYVFINELATAVHERGMSVLVEIHAHHAVQREVARRVDRVYDFALPPLILHALFEGTSERLRRWLKMSPRNAVTVLDTHDGIGVIDVGPMGETPGLLTARELDRLVGNIHVASAGESREATGAAAANLDLYQVNCTYYSALGCDDARYLAARVIQFFSPGVPQVYYAGLLAAPNDMGLLRRSGVGRDINRPRFDRVAIERALERPVVRALVGLARFRSGHPAFVGAFLVLPGRNHEIRLRWDRDGDFAEATVDLRDGTFAITASGEDGPSVLRPFDLEMLSSLPGLTPRPSR